MTKVGLFSPYERIATELAEKTKPADVIEMSISFDDIPDRKFAYEFKYKDRNFGLSEEENLKGRLSQTLSGKVLFVTKDGSSVERNFRCYNVLRVSQPYSDIEPRNVRIGTLDVCAPESAGTRETHLISELDLAEENSVVYDARPFDQYHLISKTEDGTYILLGPSSNSPVSYLLGNLPLKAFKYEEYSIPENVYELSVDEWFAEKFGIKKLFEGKGGEESPWLNFLSKYFIRTKGSDPETRQFNFVNTAGISFGGEFSPSTYLRTLEKFIATDYLSGLLSLDEVHYDSEGRAFFEVRQAHQFCVPVQFEHEFYDETMMNSQHLREIFDCFSLDSKNVKLKGYSIYGPGSDEGIKLLMKSALLVGRLNFYDIIMMFIGLVSTDLTKVDTTVDTLGSAIRINGIFKKGTAPDGLVVVHYDSPSEIAEDGVTNRTVLAYKIGDSYRVCIDPFVTSSHMVLGDDITSLIDAKDTNVEWFDANS